MEFIKNVLDYIMPTKSEPKFSKPEAYKNVNTSLLSKPKTQLESPDFDFIKTLRPNDSKAKRNNKPNK